jgi:hypothetical protein
MAALREYPFSIARKLADSKRDETFIQGPIVELSFTFLFVLNFFALGVVKRWLNPLSHR